MLSSFILELWARDVTSQGDDGGKPMNEPKQGDTSTVIMVKSLKIYENPDEGTVNSVEGTGSPAEREFAR